MTLISKIKDFFVKPRILLIHEKEGGTQKGKGFAFLLVSDSSKIECGDVLYIGEQKLLVTSLDVVEVRSAQ